MNIDKNLLSKIKENNLHIRFCDFDTLDDRSIKEANAIAICSYDGSDIYISMGTFLKCPIKKTVTLEWILEKINKTSDFVNLTKLMKKAIGFSGIDVYPTSYGVGMFRLFGVDKEKLKEVADFLNNNGIEYVNEFSDARWVYRYKISKKRENIEKLKKVCSI